MDVTYDRPSSRINIDADDVGRGFGQLVLAVADILRELMERQAIRRIDAGDLTQDQIEGIGTSLLRIREQITDLRAALSRDGAQNLRRDTR
jgi:hypothetical protein